VTRDRLYIDTMQQVFGNVSKVMVDSRSGSNLLYLPLDKLMQQAGAAVAAPTPAPAAPDMPPAAAADARSRDGGRSRERDGR
jgi:membrane protease subunit HflK